MEVCLLRTWWPSSTLGFPCLVLTLLCRNCLCAMWGNFLLLILILRVNNPHFHKSHVCSLLTKRLGPCRTAGRQNSKGLPASPQATFLQTEDLACLRIIFFFWGRSWWWETRLRAPPWHLSRQAPLILSLALLLEVHGIHWFLFPYLVAPDKGLLFAFRFLFLSSFKNDFCSFYYHVGGWLYTTVKLSWLLKHGSVFKAEMWGGLILPENFDPVPCLSVPWDGHGMMGQVKDKGPILC